MFEPCEQTLEKMASEMPGPVVREGGLSALLSYLDFFSTNVQRTAVTAAAHCCRSLSPESFNMVKEVAPILVNVLGYSDQRVVEQACLAVTRITESYRHHPDKLEALLTPQLFSALLALLTPGSSLLTSNTFTSVLRSLALAARASPNVAIELIQGHIADTLYHLLAGAVPPPKGKEVVGVQKRREEDDMAVLQNLVHRPKDQILEALVLASELLPTLPRDGLFSSKPNASRSKAGKKATVKVIKREESSPAPSGSSALVPSHGALAEPLDVPATSVASAEPAESISQQPQQTPHQEQEDEEAMQSVAAAQVKTEETSPTIDSSSAASTAPSAALTAAKAAANLKEAANDLRIDLLQNTSPPERLETVARFHALLLPTLVDVYSASVGISVRSKSMLALTKIMHFAPKDLLALVLESLPVASFLGAILASKDQPLLVTNGLQVVELLLLKLPDKCNYLFRRQGVLHEVERLAEVPLNSPPKDKEKQKGAEEGEFDHGVPSVANTSTGGLNRGFLLGSLARTSVADLGAGVGDESHFKDLVTLRARFMRDRYCAANSNSSSAIQATKDLESIKLLAAQLESCNEGPHSSIDLKDILHRIANLFSNTDNPISSFELQESGLIDALLKFALGQRDLSGKHSIAVMAHV